MAKTKFIQIRVTKSQFEQIKNNAYAKGFINISAYIRKLALEQNSLFERKINEMYDTLITKDKKQT